MIKLKCNTCGFTKEVSDSYEFDNDCIICGSAMQKECSKEKLKDIVKEHCETQMKDNIVKLGNNRVWHVIENLANPKTRIRYRKLFFDAGGEFKGKEV